MSSQQFNATTLRTTLLVLVVIMTAAIVGGFYYAETWLSDIAVEVNNSSAELTNKSNADTLAQLQTELTALKPIANKASALFVSDSSYVSTIATDVKRYASATGLQINDVSSSQLPAGTKYLSNTAAIPGVQTKYVKITINNPVSFTGLIKFIKALETNIPKMKLTGLSLTHIEGDSDQMSVQPIIVEVYTK